MRDRPICVTCGRPRWEHYNEDGSWNDRANEKAGCKEFEGRSATKAEAKQFNLPGSEGDK